MKRPFITMGLPLLVTALLVLLLVSFSLLSLSAARQDLQRSEQLAQRQQEWYAANNRAQEVLHQLKAGEAPAVPVTEGEGTLCYEIPISDAQSLRVTLEAGTLTVLGWQTVSTR